MTPGAAVPQPGRQRIHRPADAGGRKPEESSDGGLALSKRRWRAGTAAQRRAIWAHLNADSSIYRVSAVLSAATGKSKLVVPFGGRCCEL